MKPDIKGGTPDYMAMAHMLEQIAYELRQKTNDQSDLKQAERLEQIAADMKASIT